MDIEAIKALAEILAEQNLSLIEVCEGDHKIRLQKDYTCPAPGLSQQQAPQPAPTIQLWSREDGQQAVDFNKLVEVKSPLVGIFYAAAVPDAEPFVSIGSKVKQGDTLCIIEAMKLMNEIKAETDGEIVDICVKNGDIAEYGQVLFRIF